ncbi:MAG: NAD kinase [Streptosporangiaceae bacterium]
MSDRSVLIVAHTGVRAALRSAQFVVERLSASGLSVRVLDTEADSLRCEGVERVPVTSGAAEGVEMVIVLGGDGTLLRAAELAHPVGAPLLGVNLGRIGFLAEAEREDVTSMADGVVEQRYDIEERMTVDVAVQEGGVTTAATWALNEAAVEKAERQRMIEVVAEIDGRPLTRWGCDGVVCATPTGSTGWAFSAGGPVVWPEVEALLLVPISAHALFSRPLLVAPTSVLALELLPGSTQGVVWCDGRRRVDLSPGSRVEVRRGVRPVRLARLHRQLFTDRLVAKFGLPVAGWRGRQRTPLGTTSGTER